MVVFVGPKVWHTGEIEAQSKLNFQDAVRGNYSVIEPGQFRHLFAHMHTHDAVQ